MGQKNNQSVERAFMILETIAQEQGLGVTELSSRLDLNKSTAFGIIKTLANLGYILKDEETDKYHLGLKLKNLAELGAKGIGILDFAKPYLKPLSEKYGEIVHFVQAEDRVVLYMDKIESTRAIRVHTGIGSFMPMYCTGVGKAILATRTDDEIRAYAKEIDFRKHTENTILNVEDLLENIAQIRKQGYSVDDGEIQEELYCLAVAIENQAGEGQYALSISMPMFRKDHYDMQEMIEDLTNTKNKIEEFFQ